MSLYQNDVWAEQVYEKLEEAGINPEGIDIWNYAGEYTYPEQAAKEIIKRVRERSKYGEAIFN